MDENHVTKLVTCFIAVLIAIVWLIWALWVVQRNQVQNEEAKEARADLDADDDHPLPAAERLRSPSTVRRPDPRKAPPCEDWAESFKRHHAAVARLELAAAAPEHIQIAFETARNLYLYAWYVYRFYPVAEMQALVTLEAGLRARLPEQLPPPYQRPSQKKPMLHGLLNYAIAQGLVRNEGFRRWHENAEQRARQRRDMERLMLMVEHGIAELAFDEGTAVEVQPQDQDWDLVGHLRTSLPYRRNAHAHGDAGLTDQVLGSLELVADILNQLFFPADRKQERHDHTATSSNDDTPSVAT